MPNCSATLKAMHLMETSPPTNCRGIKNTPAHQAKTGGGVATQKRRVPTPQAMKDGGANTIMQ